MGFLSTLTKYSNNLSKHAKEISWSYVSKFISIGGGGVLLLILPNVLGTQKYGQFSLLLSYVAVLGVFFANSINESLKSDIASYGFNKRSFQVFSEGMKLKLILFFIASVIFVSVLNFVPHTVLTNYTWLFLTLLFMMNFWGFIIATFEAVHLLSYVAIMYAIEYSIKIGGFILIFVFDKVSLPAVIIIFILSYFFAFIVGLGILLKKYKGQYISSSIFSFMPEIDKTLLKRTLFLGLSGISFVILARIDILMVGNILNEENAGLYGLASDYAKKGALLSMPIVLGVAPLFATSRSSLYLFRKFLKRIFFINIVIFILLLISSIPFVLFIYGESFLPAGYVLMILGIFPLFSVIQNYTQQILVIIDKSHITFITALFAAILNIIGNYIGIITIGIYGAAISTIISYTCWSVLNSILVYKSLSNRKR
jgi:O-antigen/teichoic acid export membrane protein